MQYTGARRNAALHAKWEHVDWRNKQLHLFTKRNNEVVVVNPKLEALLLDMHQRRVPLESGKLSAFLFPSPRPGPKGDCCLANFQKTYDTVRSKANLPDLNPHDLRHWFISMCVMEGFDFMSIAEWVGHSDGGVLIGKVYGHLNPGHKRQLASRLSFGEKKAAPADLSKASVSELSVADLLKLMQQANGNGTPPPTPAAAAP